MPLVLNGTTGVQDNSGAFVAGTAVASTSGTSIDFTSIPSWVKRVTVMINSVSLSGSANFLIQIGDAGGVETTGYSSSSFYGGSAYGQGSSTSGYISINGNSANIISGAFTFTKLTGNVWIMTSESASNGAAIVVFATGIKTLSDTLDRVRFTTSNGTDTFTAGSINILYE
jgi:hypothetical protein